MKMYRRYEHDRIFKDHRGEEFKEHRGIARFFGDDATYIKRKGETSPPFPGLTLNDGDKLNSNFFPKLL